MVAIIAIMASCTKEGPQGPAGTNGVDGADGEDGNANVQVLLWNTAPTPTAGGTFHFRHGTITSQIIEEGAVLYYYLNGGNWVATPYFNSGATYGVRPAVSTGVLTLTTFGGATFDISNTKSRIVLIGGSGKGTLVITRTKPWASLNEMEKAQSLYPNVDFSDYNAVKKAFKLK